MPENNEPEFRYMNEWVNQNQKMKKIIISALSPCNSLQEPGDLISNECYFRNKERNNKTNKKQALVT
ncbi:hypothetical protein DQK32_18680 [Salmonella enterica subsp. enterica serovar Newport]|uniref:Uncharacterized protein n=1 Tax=Salmonella newport TaxID=108619 RepID=A0A5U9VUR4_SALNE|nr:hypothetical protein [Salmonella enterica subsp. enterica serovar Newport]